MHCLTAWGQWALRLLQCTIPLPRGIGQWNSWSALPHCSGVVGSGTPATYCPIAWGQRAVQLLQCTAPLHGGSGQCNSRNALPHCLGAVGSATPATHCLTAWGRWAVECLQCAGAPAGWTGSPAPEAVAAYVAVLLQCTALPPGGSEQWNSCYALPHCSGAVGSGTPAMREPTSWGESYSGGGRCPKSGNPATHCHAAWGQWAAELLSCRSTLLRGSGQRAVQLLQCTATPPGGGGH